MHEQLGSETAVVAIDARSERKYSEIVTCLFIETCVNTSCRNLSYMKQLGPETAVVAIDARSERTRERVLDTPSWMEVFHRVGGLPRSIRHVIVMLPPPLHYPSVNLYLFPSFPVAPVRWHLSYVSAARATPSSCCRRRCTTPRCILFSSFTSSPCLPASFLPIRGTRHAIMMLPRRCTHPSGPP